jgi:hypothetical protein
MTTHGKYVLLYYCITVLPFLRRSCQQFKIVFNRWKILNLLFSKPFPFWKGLIWICILTINVPLFKKLRDIIFFLRDSHFMSHFKGHFEGAKTFLTP